MRRIAALGTVMLLAACATPQPRIETVEVKIPVPVTCLKGDAPARPAIVTKAQLLALSDYDLVLELAAERAELTGYIDQLEAVIRGCSQP